MSDIIPDASVDSSPAAPAADTSTASASETPVFREVTPELRRELSSRNFFATDPEPGSNEALSRQADALRGPEGQPQTPPTEQKPAPGTTTPPVAAPTESGAGTPPAEGESAEDDIAIPKGFADHPRWQKIHKEAQEGREAKQRLAALETENQRLTEKAKVADTYKPVIDNLRKQGIESGDAYLLQQQATEDEAFLNQREVEIRTEVEGEFPDAEEKVVDALVAARLQTERDTISQHRAEERKTAERERQTAEERNRSYEEEMAHVDSTLAEAVKTIPELDVPIVMDGGTEANLGSVMRALYETARAAGDETPFSAYVATFGQIFQRFGQQERARGIADYVAKKEKSNADVPPAVTSAGGQGLPPENAGEPPRKIRLGQKITNFFSDGESRQSRS